MKSRKLRFGLTLATVILSASLARGALISLGDIMPLGDSITDGSVAGGYRDPLYTDLTNAGYSFTFVGHDTDMSTSLLTSKGETHHEGNSGYTIQVRDPSDPSPAGTGRGGVADNIATFVSDAGSNINYFLLMIGTNDVDLDYYLSDAPSRLSNLISLITNKTTGLQPNAHVIVAEITPFGPGVSGSATLNTNAEAFNAAIPGIVAAHDALGEHVTYVDMFDALSPTSDIGSDGIHPILSGYDKMATVWAAGIQATIPEPTAAAILIVGGVPLLLRRRGR